MRRHHHATAEKIQRCFFPRGLASAARLFACGAGRPQRERMSVLACSSAGSSHPSQNPPEASESRRGPARQTGPKARRHGRARRLAETTAVACAHPFRPPGPPSCPSTTGAVGSVARTLRTPVKSSSTPWRLLLVSVFFFFPPSSTYLSWRFPLCPLDPMLVQPPFSLLLTPEVPWPCTTWPGSYLHGLDVARRRHVTRAPCLVFPSIPPSAAYRHLHRLARPRRIDVTPGSSPFSTNPFSVGMASRLPAYASCFGSSGTAVDFT